VTRQALFSSIRDPAPTGGRLSAAADNLTVLLDQPWPGKPFEMAGQILDTTLFVYGLGDDCQAYDAESYFTTISKRELQRDNALARILQLEQNLRDAWVESLRDRQALRAQLASVQHFLATHLAAPLQTETAAPAFPYASESARDALLTTLNARLSEGLGDRYRRAAARIENDPDLGGDILAIDVFVSIKSEQYIETRQTVLSIIFAALPADDASRLVVSVRRRE
jgi:hypothetical protein